jgi:hypothetical protein
MSTPTSIAECQVETQKHIERVRFYIRKFTDALTTRGVKHDACKLESPEVEVFAEHTPALATTGYDTPEYHEHLAAMKEALVHHYAQSRHHPEHFDDGILGMNLIDLVEMFCDWKAATERHNDGNLLKSIQVNAQRFGYDDQLKRIFLNTAKLFDEQAE